jgi:protein-S-isoprenylcysteine O-methyltransferase Ste14
MTSTPQQQRSDIARNISEILINVLLGVLFTVFAYAAFLSWRDGGHPQMLLLAIQEGIIVGLVVIRRRVRDASIAWWDRVVAIAGTAAPLLQRAEPTSIIGLELAGSALQLAGIGLSLFATISLGRSFGIVAANRGVRTMGLYRFVRHPLYGSYAVSYLGFLLGNPSIWNFAMIATAVLCQYLRATAEERVLMRDPEYQAYMERVRFRFFPYIF